MENTIKTFIQKPYTKSKEWNQVKAISKKFTKFLSEPKNKKKITEFHIPGAQSHRIEEVITPLRRDAWFYLSSKRTFPKIQSIQIKTRLLSTGIIIEVERGKTSQNNAALKDLWKAHICEEAHYLFLFVPMELRQNKKDPNKISGRLFNETVNRLSTFFVEENCTNVRGLVIFGY